MSNIILSCKNICKSFTYGDNFSVILNNISLDIYEKDFVVILGPSGSGKTTLLNILAGLEKQTSGEVYIDDVLLNTKNARIDDEIRANKIGYIFQNYALLPLINVYDNIAMSLLKKKIHPSEIYNLMKDLKIEKLANKFPHELSGGQKQRIAIARTLIKKPEIIFCDEPTGALDDESTQEVISLFREMNNNGKTILIITHDERLTKLANRVIRIKDGQLEINKDFDISQIVYRNLDIKDQIAIETIKLTSTSTSNQKQIITSNNQNVLKNKQYIDARPTSVVACIQTKNVSKCIEIKSQKNQLIFDLNLEINEGDFAVICGESGSGKSTLLGIISGLDSNYEGETFVLNNKISDYKESKLTKFRRDNVGFIFQNSGLLLDISVLDNVMLSIHRKYKKYAIDILKYLGLENEINQKARYLSGGQQQRVAIARAIIRRPKILFADEPTGAIDSKTAIDIMNILKHINLEYNITIVMVTHNPDYFDIGNRTIKIKDGRICNDVINSKSVIPNSLI